MSKLLSEGLFSKIIASITKGKVNRGVEQLKKDPKIKKAIDKYEDSTQELKVALDNFEDIWGEKF